MGFYIETPKNRNKADQLVILHGAVIVPKPVFDDVPQDKAVIVVVNNIAFDAAGLAYSEKEFLEFTDPSDNRGKTFLLMDKKLAHRLSGYSE